MPVLSADSAGVREAATSGQRVALFHPWTQWWKEHFQRLYSSRLKQCKCRLVQGNGVIGQLYMDWQPYIYSEPGILLGKPVVKGTRLAGDFLLRLFAAGWTEQQVLDNYPTLTPEALRAVFAFAAECMREEALYVLPTVGKG